MSRLFVAIPLSEEMRKAVTASLHDMKQKGIKGSFVPTQNLHLTLAFIGETHEVQKTKDALSAVSVKPFRLALSELGCFGDLLYDGVKGNQGLNQTARSVRDALDAAGLPYDKKKFEPHITLIRKLGGNWKTLAPPKGEMMVKTVSLMKSEEKNGKRVYTELLRI